MSGDYVPRGNYGDDAPDDDERDYACFAYLRNGRGAAQSIEFDLGGDTFKQRGWGYIADVDITPTRISFPSQYDVIVVEGENLHTSPLRDYLLQRRVFRMKPGGKDGEPVITRIVWERVGENQEPDA